MCLQGPVDALLQIINSEAASDPRLGTRKRWNWAAVYY